MPILARLARFFSSQPFSPDPGIFREYDIRGIVGETLHGEDAYWIGRAFAALVAGEKDAAVVLGRDGRMSSPMLIKELARGVTDCGVRVIDIGLAPTPMLYFAAHSLNASGGIMLTGSHNPPDHNGFKFILHNHAFFGKDIQALRVAIETANFPKGRGTVEKKDLHAVYLDSLVKAYDGTRNLRVAWDAGNGATGEVMTALCKKLPGEHVTLFADIDGTFPNHHPDPTVAKNLKDLIAEVRSKKLDAGIAFDGDGDRIGVVDDEGEILWGDQLLMLYAADILRERPGATVIADVKASQTLFDQVAKLGGKPLMWKTGHSLIKSKMKETGAPVAGEMSGHIFFADKYYGFDDALYAAVRLLGLLSRSGQKLSDLRKALPKAVNTPEIRFHCDDARKFAVIEEVRKRLAAKGASFSDVDGVRVAIDGGWWLLRASNTQPMLVARAEAPDQAILARLKDDLRAELKQSGVELPN
jgi:phosphomannomutase